MPRRRRRRRRRRPVGNDDDTVLCFCGSVARFLLHLPFHRLFIAVRLSLASLARSCCCCCCCCCWSVVLWSQVFRNSVVVRNTQNVLHAVCVCVCVCERERERERGIKQKTKQKKRNGRPHPADLVDVDDPMAGALTRLLFFRFPR